MATFSCDNAPMNNPVIVCENLTVNYWLTDPEPPPSAGQSGAVDNAQNPTKPTEKPKASAKKGTGKGASAKANKNGQGNGQNKPKGKSKGARKRERKRERNRVKWQKQYQDVVARQNAREFGQGQATLPRADAAGLGQEQRCLPAAPHFVERPVVGQTSNHVDCWTSDGMVRHGVLAAYPVEYAYAPQVQYLPAPLWDQEDTGAFAKHAPIKTEPGSTNAGVAVDWRTGLTSNKVHADRMALIDQA